MTADDDDSLLSEKNKMRCIEEFNDLKPLRKPRNPRSLASVLIPIIDFNENRGPGLLYTKRSAKLSSHAREVCFPGGKKVKNCCQKRPIKNPIVEGLFYTFYV